VKIAARAGDFVFVNGSACAAAAGCAVEPRKPVHLLVFNYGARSAWEARLDSPPPASIAPRMDACTRTVTLVSEPGWAYVAMRNHLGQAIEIPISMFESRPQTPKQVARVPCGVYQVTFEPPDQPSRTTRVTVAPSSPAVVTVQRP
jgi:hypothetical protein